MPQAAVLSPACRSVHGEELAAGILENRRRQLSYLADAQPGSILPVQAAEAFQLPLVKLRDKPVYAPEQRRLPTAAAAAEHDAAPFRYAPSGLPERGSLFLRILEFKFKIYHVFLFSFS